MRIRLVSEGLDEILYLIDFLAVRCAPVTPLIAVDRPELAVLVGPFIPDGHAALLQPVHVGVAAQEPEELIEDGLQMQLLRGEEGEAVLEAKAKLAPEHRQRPRASAIRLARAVLEHLRDEIEVLLLARGLHRPI